LPIWREDGADKLLVRGQPTIEIALQVGLSANAPVDISREQVSFVLRATLSHNIQTFFIFL
jgi:hypothetical protein